MPLDSNRYIKFLFFRRIRYGFFSLDHALLMKHADMENVLNNMYLLGQMIRENEHLIASTANFVKPSTENSS